MVYPIWLNVKIQIVDLPIAEIASRDFANIQRRQLSNFLSKVGSVQDAKVIAIARSKFLYL